MNDADPSAADRASAPDPGFDPGSVAPDYDTTALPVLEREIPPATDMVSILGPRDELLRTMERQFPLVEAHVRGNEMTFTGPRRELEIIDGLVDELLTIVETGQPLNRDAVERSISMLRSRTTERPADVLTMNIVSSRGRTIRPKTLNQKRYVDAIDRHTIVFAIGPAGTGKTYLAMAKAVAALQAKQVNRIILIRPAVEAGERLGYLPGTLNEKIDPYLRPLYDALHDMVSPETIPRLMASGTIEVAPLAYMRGRAQPLDSQVLTPDGFRDFGSLQVGDLVVGADGLPTPVIGVHPQGRKEVYRLTTQDGASTLCCGEHLWTVRTPEDARKGRWRTLETKDLLGQLRSGAIPRFELPIVGPVEFAPQQVQMDAYALGRLLDDSRVTRTSGDAYMLDMVRKEAGGRGGLRVATPAATTLPTLGPAGAHSWTTFVPPVYLYNSAAVRLSLLQGLLDADAGSVTRAGRSCGVRYTTKSPYLRDDAIFLVRSLGGVAHSHTPPARGRQPRPGPGAPLGHRHDAYVVDIRLPAGLSPFRSDRRLAAYDRAAGGRPMRHIESIEPAGYEETMCIQVASKDSLYVTDDFLVTHNSLNDAFIVLDEAQNTSSEQMKMFLTRLGFGSKMVVTGDVTQVDLPGGTRSGLLIVRDILGDVEDIHFTELTSQDVVRHRLVSAIVDAYERDDVRVQQRARRAAKDVAARAAPRRKQAGRHTGRGSAREDLG